MMPLEKSQVAKIKVAILLGTGKSFNFLLANIFGYRVGLPYRKKIIYIIYNGRSKIKIYLIR